MLGMWICTISFIVIIGAFIFFNAKITRGFKVETSWVLIALVPGVFYLIGSGKLSEFSGFGLELKLMQASAKPFSLNSDGAKIATSPLTVEEKGGSLGAIPELVRRKVQALALKVGKKNYYNNDAILAYLDELTKYDFFKYIVFLTEGETFKGIIPARSVYEQMKQKKLDLVRALEEGKTDKSIGIIDSYVRVTSSKQDALKKLEENNLTEIPVTDDEGRLIGIVDRGKLTSSILLELLTRS
jgi:CBS domain-containing protein